MFDIDYTVTVGNLLTIGGFALSAFALANKMTKFIALTEFKFQAGEKKFSEHDTALQILESKCKECPNVKEVTYLKSERERMNKEQVLLRGQLPIQLETMSSDIAEIKVDIAAIRERFMGGHSQ